MRGWEQPWAPLHDTSKDGFVTHECTDARGEGEPVGEGVGEGVGESVGADVGAAVGARVGASVGVTARHIQGWNSCLHDS